MKILVIDDEKPTLSMFKLFLTAYGYEVFTAETGEKGLALFNEVRPQIVFTDIKMPGMDGLEVLREIRKTHIHSQVIIITGHGDMEKAVEALDLDASDFINKPVERQALNSALARAEKRQSLPPDMDFSISAQTNENRLLIHISGKLTRQAQSPIEDALKPVTDPDKPGKIDTVCFAADDFFSINRSGISVLIQTIQMLKSKKIHIVLENVSYNYSRILQMAGIDKFAQIVEARVED